MRRELTGQLKLTERKQLQPDQLDAGILEVHARQRRAELPRREQQRDADPGQWANNLGQRRHGECPGVPDGPPKCERYMPRAQASQSQSAQQTQRGLQFARCMRSHGVPNFPDPKVITGTASNQEAYLPGIDPQSPAFQSAAKACGGGPKGP